MSHSRVLALFVLFLLISPVALHAQNSGVILTVAVQQNRAAEIGPILQQYDADHPELEISVVTPQLPAFSSDNIETYLDDFAAYTQEADVHMGISVFDPLTTRAGYFLNLNVFTDADPSFQKEDFYQPMLASYQWDGGTWALPIGADIQMMFYDPAAFDEAGLDYPGADWTVDDLRVAAEELAGAGGDGTATSVPITTSFSVPYLSILSMDEPLYDLTQSEITPAIDALDLEALVERWLNLESEGFMTREQASNRPIVLTWSTTSAILPADRYQVAPIPDASPTVLPIAAGISAGTAHPDEAYELVKFLIQGPAIANVLRMPISGLRSVTESSTSSLIFDDEIREYAVQSAESAQPYSQFLFFWYVSGAYTNITQNGMDVRSALVDAQAQAVDDLQAATNRQGTALTVNSAPEITEDQVEIRFTVVSGGNPQLWEDAAQEFVALNPAVAHVRIITSTYTIDSPTSQNRLIDASDCFFIPFVLNTSEHLSDLLPLDPLLSIDPDIDINDFLPGTIARLSQNDLLYGFPLNVQPEVIVYNIDQFEAMGAARPFNGWTVTDFEESLRTMRTDPNDPPVMESRPYVKGYILNLLAVYGGLPLDFRTDPPTIDFTSEATVNAIRQVLDLEKDGFLQYDPLTTEQDESLFPVRDASALHVQYLNPFHHVRMSIDAIDTSSGNYGYVMFPGGRDYIPVDYDLGAAYISAETPHFAPCYDFIKFISERPDVYGDVPARTSVLDSELLRQLEDDETLAFYRAVHDVMRQPNVIEFPYSGTIDFVVHANNLVRLWLFRAMDRYVFEDADLEVELADAETFARAYLECTSSIAPFDPTTQNAQGYFSGFLNCFDVVDPTF